MSFWTVFAVLWGFCAGVVFMMFCTASAIEELWRRRMREQQGKSGTFRIIIKDREGERIRPDIRFGGRE